LVKKMHRDDLGAPAVLRHPAATMTRRPLRVMEKVARRGIA
jgi:hypothetical protein